MGKLIVFFLTILIVGNVWAQSNIPVGTWQTHNAYNETIAVASSNDEIIVAVSSAVYIYNRSQNSSEQITRLSGLSDSEITAVGFNENQDIAIVSYLNGNIDLIGNSRVRNFRDLLAADIPGSKRINHIYSYNNLAYLSADFGVMVIDLEKTVVKDSYFELGVDGAPIEIYSSAILNDTLYLATEEGIIGGSLEDNLKDFNNWRRYGIADGLPQSRAALIVQSGNGLLAAFDQSGLFENINGAWENKNLLQDEFFIMGSAGNQGSLLVSDSSVYLYNDGAVQLVEDELISLPKSAVFVNNEVVIGDGQNGLLFPASQESFYPNGPLSNQIVRLFGFKDEMVALPPAYDDNFNPLDNRSGFFIFKDGEWTNYNSSGNPGTVSIPEFYDISDAMYSYYTESLYLASFGYGIMEIRDDQFIIYDDTNSSLINTNPPAKNIFVTALDATSTTLSAVNFNSSLLFHQLNLADDLWNGSSITTQANNAIQVRGFENNTHWLQTASNIIVFDAENQRELVLDNSVLLSDGINDMAIDLEGKMWVATDNGIIYFYNASSILDQTGIDPVQPVYEGRILFRGERLTALAVDGGNRIWMATSTGVWLFASNGFELVDYFNVDNSPLPSNNILDISVNHQTGEVFFATDAGLVSYRGTATISSVEEPLKIFPNPVLRSQHDIVTIQGVPTDANFWIADSSGRLVYKSKANGNTAIWNGISSNAGLSSGVYFVYVTTENGEQKQVGKIAVIN